MMNESNPTSGEVVRSNAATGTALDIIPGGAAKPMTRAQSAILATALPPDTSPSPLGLLRALKRRLALALGLALMVSGLSSAAAWHLIPAKYRATATLVVRSDRPQIAFDSDVAHNSAEDYRRYQKTQLGLLKSRRVINSALLQPGINQLRMVRDELYPIEWLQDNLQAQFAQDSELLEISLGGDNPQEVAKLVNAVQTAFMDDIVNTDQRNRQNRHEQLRKLKQSYTEMMKTRRETLRKLATDTGSDDRSTLVLEQQYSKEQIAAVRKELQEVESSKRKIEAILRIHRPDGFQETAAQGVSLDDVVRLVEQDPEVSALRGKLADLEDRLDSETTHTGRVARSAALNPALKSLRDEVNSAKKQLEKKRKAIRPLVIRQLLNPPDDGRNLRAGGTLEQQLAFWNEVEARLKEKKTELEKSDRKKTENTLDIQDLQDEMKQTQETAEKIAHQAEVLEIELQAPPRIVKFEEARPPETRDLKKFWMYFSVISAGSFILTLFGIAFLELRCQKVDTADEVVASLGLPVVGSLPMLPSKARRQGAVATRGKARHWYNLLLESIDATRTMLIHAARGGSDRVVMITSALSGEGKTSLASHLATSLARSGIGTLLIDADLRCPSIHRLFELAPEPGLSEVLRGEAALDDVIVSTAIAELKVITAGLCDHRTLRIISQGGMGGLFARLKENYEFVIVDSSPVLPVADALIIAQQVDAVLLSVLTEVSRKHKVFAAHQRLATLGVRVLGAVVTGAHNGVYGTNYYPGAQPSSESDSEQTTSENTSETEASS
jgi:capsular exopolysaccharide synthesis family protein